MILPQFLRFYNGYTVKSVMAEYAVTFFSLVNDMYRLKADEILDGITSVSVGMSGDQSAVEKLQKSSKGLKGIVQEVRTVKGVK